MFKRSFFSIGFFLRSSMTVTKLQQHAQRALKNFDEEMVTEIYAEGEVEDEGDEGELEECK